MSGVEPVDPRVRLAISQWPDDPPRGAVTSFCTERGISRKTFYVLLARARAEGPAAALEPRSRRPRTSPSRIGEETKEQEITSHPIAFGSGEWTCVIGEFEGGGRMVTVAKWKDGAIAEEYIWA